MQSFSLLYSLMLFDQKAAELRILSVIQPLSHILISQLCLQLVGCRIQLKTILLPQQIHDLQWLLKCLSCWFYWNRTVQKRLNLRGWR